MNHYGRFWTKLVSSKLLTDLSQITFDTFRQGCWRKVQPQINLIPES